MELTNEQKQELHNYINNMSIDYSSLDSYHYDSNPYMVEPQLVGSSGCYAWDEDEEYQVKLETLINEIPKYGIENYLKLTQEQLYNDTYVEELQKTTLCYLNKLYAKL